MKVLHYKNNPQEDYFLHHVCFQFDDMLYDAYVREDYDETSVFFCYESITKRVIDIPSYFGEGFSSKVYDLIYNRIEEQLGENTIE
jgi:hypothetical protein